MQLGARGQGGGHVELGGVAFQDALGHEDDAVTGPQVEGLQPVLGAPSDPERQVDVQFDLGDLAVAQPQRERVPGVDDLDGLGVQVDPQHLAGDELAGSGVGLHGVVGVTRLVVQARAPAALVAQAAHPRGASSAAATSRPAAPVIDTCRESSRGDQLGLLGAQHPAVQGASSGTACACSLPADRAPCGGGVAVPSRTRAGPLKSAIRNDTARAQERVVSWSATAATASMGAAASTRSSNERRPELGLAGRRLLRWGGPAAGFRPQGRHCRATPEGDPAARSGRAQAAALVSQKIVSICAM